MEIRSPLKVVVGEYYNVPCVEDLNGILWPIVGPSHVDGADLCQSPPTAEHYHMDYRFISQQYENFGLIKNNDKIVYRRLRCARERADNGQTLWAMIRLGRVYQNHQINISNPVCPHKRQQLVNPDGKCPGHGFCWDMETGRPKYRYPFYTRFKGEEKRYLASDRANFKMPCEFEESKHSPITVELIDSDDQVIGEHIFLDHGVVNKNDVFRISTSCTEEI